MSTGAKKSGVGYGKPPKSSQWKPGQSGNPSGKKKTPKPDLLAAAFAKELARPVRIKIDGKVMELTFAEVIAKKSIMKAVDEDPHKLAAFIKLLKSLGSVAAIEVPEAATDDDEPVSIFTEEHRRLLEIARRDAGM